jgi:hypothetical protein
MLSSFKFNENAYYSARKRTSSKKLMPKLNSSNNEKSFSNLKGSQNSSKIEFRKVMYSRIKHQKV